MRIGYIVSRFPSTTETFIAREMSALQDRGTQIELFALVRQEGVVSQPEADAFTAQHVHPLSIDAVRAQWTWLRRSPRRLLTVWWQAVAGNASSPAFLARALVVVPMAAWFAIRVEQEQVERVHAHWATHSALAAWVVSQLTGRPYSITAHAHDIFMDQAMLRRKLADADFVAVVSEFNAAFLRERYPAEVAGKLVVVRCGVDPARFAPTESRFEPTESNACRGSFRLACVASLQDYKGHSILIEAVDLLRSRGHRVQVDLVGDGELRPALERLVRDRGLTGDIAFLGALPSPQVVSVLRRCQAFVLPSVVTQQGKMEGIPVALMEASAVELPVIASALSGIPELVLDRSTGLLVEPGDPVALADAIDRLRGDAGLRHAMGRAGRQRVLAGFTAAANADRLLGLLSDASPVDSRA